MLNLLDVVEIKKEIEKIGNKEIAVVIPALNEEESISKVLDQINISLVNYNYKILITCLIKIRKRRAIHVPQSIENQA